MTKVQEEAINLFMRGLSYHIVKIVLFKEYDMEMMQPSILKRVLEYQKAKAGKFWIALFQMEYRNEANEKVNEEIINKFAYMVMYFFDYWGSNKNYAL